MKTRLIVLIDFSPSSLKLLELAKVWSQSLNFSLLLVHQVSAIVPALADSESRNHIIDVEIIRAEKELKKLAADNLKDLKNVSLYVTAKNLSMELPLLLNGSGNDIVMTGLKGTGVLKKILIGSTTTKIIEETNAVVVAVPPGMHNSIPDKLVVSVNTKYPLNQASLNNILEVFENNIRHIEFISVVDSGNDDEKEISALVSSLSNFYRKEVTVTHKLLKGKNVIVEIKKYIEENHQDSYLVVQRGSRLLADKLFRKLLINELVHDGSMPLIVVP